VNNLIALHFVDMEDIFSESLIDIPLWDAAGWKGTAFLHDPSGMERPGLGFLFDDMDAGRRIFLGWQERVGKVDEYEEIRVSIILGEILGLPSGYSLHISSDPSHAARRARDKGLALDFKTAIIVSRIKRMTPNPGSPHLGQFQEDLARHGRYLLVPVSSKGTPALDVAIEKHEIHLRQASEIGPHDLDAAVFPEHYFDNDDRPN
jgi:hypothetical protein